MHKGKTSAVTVTVTWLLNTGTNLIFISCDYYYHFDFLGLYDACVRDCILYMLKAAHHDFLPREQHNEGVPPPPDRANTDRGIESSRSLLLSTWPVVLRSTVLCFMRWWIWIDFFSFYDKMYRPACLCIYTVYVHFRHVLLICWEIRSHAFVRPPPPHNPPWPPFRWRFRLIAFFSFLEVLYFVGWYIGSVLCANCFSSLHQVFHVNSRMIAVQCGTGFFLYFIFYYFFYKYYLLSLMPRIFGMENVGIITELHKQSCVSLLLIETRIWEL